MRETDVKPELVGGEALQKAMTQAVLDAAQRDNDGEVAVEKKSNGNRPRPVGKGGVPVPGGRPKGVPNKTTATIREAVMQAFHQVGGPEYLVRLAEGTQSDRAAFTSLLNKVLPTQINANVEGGIQVQLSWLGQRQIGATAAQPADVVHEPVTQVIDLERDSKGKYKVVQRIEDPQRGDVGGAGGAEGAGDAQEVGK